MVAEGRAYGSGPNEMSDAVTELRNALTTGEGTFLMTEVRESFDRIVRDEDDLETR